MSSDARMGQPARSDCPANVKTIVLRLARNAASELLGARAEGYVITAPLDAAGYLDASGLGTERWPVRRFGDLSDGETGWLAHRGDAWFIDYDDATSSDDEPIFRLSDHRFAIGEYLTINTRLGKALTYRVAEIEPMA